MGLRNTALRRPHRVNKHKATVVRRRKKVRWLAAQRARVRNYRRFFRIQSELMAKAEEGRMSPVNPSTGREEEPANTSPAKANTHESEKR